MSLLDRGFDETVTVYQEEAIWDKDGNIRTQAATTGGVETRARITVEHATSSSRSNTMDHAGFEDAQIYLLRLPRSFPFVLKGAAVVWWNGQKWGLVGDAVRYSSSRKTSHIVYVIKRN